MSFEKIPEPERERIGTFGEALTFLLREGEPGARKPEFQDFVAQKESEVETPLQTLELSFDMAELYYKSGFKEYALECFKELEIVGGYAEEEADLFDRAKEFIEIIEKDLNNG